MFNIVVCDDEKKFREKMKCYIQRYQERHDVWFCIREFADGNELINKMPKEIDILFLDIKMEVMDGIKAAKKIRSFNEWTPIVFLTSAVEYALEGYKVDAFDYLIKPISYEKFDVVLSKILKKISINRNKPLMIKSNDTWYRINTSEIVFVEMLRRHCIIHTMYETYVSTKRLKDIESELDQDNFFRCNSGYIVNFDYIEKIVQSDIYLSNEDVITVSRPKKKMFITKLMEYWGGEM
ncbi:MAG TPA: response regulator transcription factor [Candidatus Merdenecus merdavium]|nr:response regulator transcription factor [Candidatus Merdenecus merdavium]